jgi:hypothetical protein
MKKLLVLSLSLLLPSIGWSEPVIVDAFPCEIVTSDNDHLIISKDSILISSDKKVEFFKPSQMGEEDSTPISKAWICPNCGYFNDHFDTYCWGCGYNRGSRSPTEEQYDP